MDEFIKRLRDSSDGLFEILSPMITKTWASERKPVRWLLSYDMMSLLIKADHYSGGVFNLRKHELLGYSYEAVATAAMPFREYKSEKLALEMSRDPPLLALEYQNRFGLTGYLFHDVTDENIRTSLA